MRVEKERVEKECELRKRVEKECEKRRSASEEGVQVEKRNRE